MLGATRGDGEDEDYAALRSVCTIVVWRLHHEAHRGCGLQCSGGVRCDCKRCQMLMDTFQKVSVTHNKHPYFHVSCFNRSRIVDVHAQPETFTAGRQCVALSMVGGVVNPGSTATAQTTRVRTIHVGPKSLGLSGSIEAQT